MKYTLALITFIFAVTAQAQVTTITDTVLRADANPSADTVAVVPGGAEITAHEAVRTYVRATYDEQDGFLHNQSLRQTEEVRELTCEARWSYMAGDSEYVSQACNRQVVVGMPEVLVRAAWGDPSSVNSTETENTRSEQWVFNRNGNTYYVYVEGGVVSTIQQ